MSGIIGMNDWEMSVKAGRRHVELVGGADVKIAKLLNEGMGDELQRVDVPTCEGVDVRGCEHPEASYYREGKNVFCRDCGKVLDKLSAVAGIDPHLNPLPGEEIAGPLRRLNRADREYLNEVSRLERDNRFKH